MNGRGLTRVHFGLLKGRVGVPLCVIYARLYLSTDSRTWQKQTRIDVDLLCKAEEMEHATQTLTTSTPYPSALAMRIILVPLMKFRGLEHSLEHLLIPIPCQMVISTRQPFISNEPLSV